MTTDPKVVRAYILGLEMAVITAKRYIGLSMINYIGELEEIMEQARNVPGYREWVSGIKGDKNDGQT